MPQVTDIELASRITALPTATRWQALHVLDNLISAAENHSLKPATFKLYLILAHHPDCRRSLAYDRVTVTEAVEIPRN